MIDRRLLKPLLLVTIVLVLPLAILAFHGEAFTAELARWQADPPPRGTLALASAVQARAWLKGRDYGVPEDVIALAPDALAHRLVPSWAARAEGRTGRSLVADILKVVEPW